MNVNKHGLKRTIDEPTKRAVRQRCGFGCVICGSGIVDYHHFSPEFADAKTHSASGITLLCGHHHKLAGNRIISAEQIANSDRSPNCKRVGIVNDLLFTSSSTLPIRFGSSLVRASTILKFDDLVVIGVDAPEAAGGPLRLNATFTDSLGNPLLNIVNNEWQVGIDRYDVRTTGNKLTIHEGPRKILFEMCLSAANELSITRLAMNYQGFQITADSDSFAVQVPSGAKFRHTGEVSSEIGIWLHSSGKAFVAANDNGGAAICIG